MALLESGSVPQENLGFAFFKSNFQLDEGIHIFELDYDVAFPNVNILFEDKIVPVGLISGSGLLEKQISVRVLSEREVELHIIESGRYTIAIK